MRCAVWAVCVAAGRAPVFRLTDGGERLSVPATLRYTSVATFLLRDWTEPELRALDRFVRPGDTFLDIGANIGLFTLKAARLCGASGQVIAVEPGREALRQLRANLALNGWHHVRVADVALSDRSGEAALHHIALGDDPQAFSLLSDGSGVPAETVRTLTLDLLAEEYGLTRLDCIKMDVEGAEPLVVAGGRATLGRFRPLVIFEINAPVALAAGTAGGCFSMLAELGYGFWQLRGTTLAPVARQPGEHGNLVAVHPDGVQPG